MIHLTHKILRRDEIPGIKLTLDIEVPLVNGRLPTSEQLAEISKRLVTKEKPHKRRFVLFFLPGMDIDGGAYATAHHTPAMRVEIQHMMLWRYPEYKTLIADPAAK